MTTEDTENTELKITRVEIITPNENNPVAEFFLSSNTPETDAETNYCDALPDMPWIDVEVARRLERERDEAREEAAHWKTEYEIVVARLCGKKHPRDNGIISEHEIIPKLTQERDEARREVDRYREEKDLSPMSWDT